MNTQHRLAVALGAAALAAGGLASTASAAPVLYGATGADSTDTSPPPVSKLYSIDPANGAATAIGSIGSAVTGLAVDPTSGTLYGVTADVERAGTQRQPAQHQPGDGRGHGRGARSAPTRSRTSRSTPPGSCTAGTRWVTASRGSARRRRSRSPASVRRAPA